LSYIFAADNIHGSIFIQIFAVRSKRCIFAAIVASLFLSRTIVVVIVVILRSLLYSYL